MQRAQLNYMTEVLGVKEILLSEPVPVVPIETAKQVPEQVSVIEPQASRQALSTSGDASQRVFFVLSKKMSDAENTLFVKMVRAMKLDTEKVFIVQGASLDNDWAAIEGLFQGPSKVVIGMSAEKIGRNEYRDGHQIYFTHHPSELITDEKKRDQPGPTFKLL